MEATTPAYPTRLSNTQWATLAAYFAADSQLGRPRNTNLPAVVEAILYVLRAGSGACCRGSFRLGRLCMATSTLARPGQLEAHSPLPTRVGAALAQASAVPLGGHGRYAVGVAGLPHPLGRRL
ncbi:MAG: hypothetical protein BRC51_00890 [Cyanobacteria bacterium SW_12_48_29]|nr:MAG: hypothetical protein BRC51_00890 [Cyanobacteria bacterium SW_12_48_29]